VLEERNVRVTASFVELFIPHARARRPAPWPLAGSCSLALHHSRSARRALIDMPSRDRKIESDDSRIADAVMRVGLSFFSIHLTHQIDLKDALGEQTFELGVLTL
jgi:hypothetical protein